MALHSVDRDLIDVVMDRRKPFDERVSAARALAEHDGATVVGALAIVAQRPDTPSDFNNAVGESLAQICFERRHHIDDVSMAEMNGDAYLAYDKAMARHLNPSGGGSEPVAR